MLGEVLGLIDLQDIKQVYVNFHADWNDTVFMFCFSKSGDCIAQPFPFEN